MAVKSLADIAAIEAVPLAERALPESTYAALAASAKRGPDRTALTFFLSAERLGKTHVWTYADLITNVTRAANLFASLGITADRPAACVLPNLPETHFTIWGGEAAGAALAINPMLEPKQISNLMRSARVSVLVTLAPALNPKTWPALASEVASLPDLKAIAFVDMADYLDEQFRQAARASIQAAASGLSLKVVNFRDVMRGQPSDRLVTGREIRGADLSSCVCTGGTTGSPKIAVRTHRNEVFDAWAASSLTETDGSPRTVLCGLPLFHVNGQLVTGLQPWMRGDHVVLATPDGYRGKNVIARFWDIVARFGVSTFSGVPTLYSAVLETPIGDNDLSSLKFAICGAAPMPLALIRAFEAKTGLKIVEGYGLTEGGCVSSVNPPEGGRPPGSIGLPIPYQRMAAVVLDANGRYERMAEIDEIGVIAINGPNVFSGYLDPQHNNGVWIDIDGERWLNTGDLGDGTPTATSGWAGARRSSSSAAGTTSTRRSSRTRCRGTRRWRWSPRSEARRLMPANCPLTFS
jgi:fatty-acyl-CoA synthase